MKIAEILDSKVDYEVVIDTKAEFQTKARIGDRIIVFDAELNDEEDDWGVLFWQTTLEGKSMRFEVTKGGSELEVFSMVRASMMQFVEERKPVTIRFTADKTRGSSRSDLYDRLLKRFKIPGYEHHKRDTGALDDYFILTRQD